MPTDRNAVDARVRNRALVAAILVVLSWLLVVNSSVIAVPSIVAMIPGPLLVLLLLTLAFSASTTAENLKPGRCELVGPGRHN